MPFLNSLLGNWLVLSSPDMHQSIFQNVSYNKATLFEVDVSSLNCNSILVVQDGVILRGKDLFTLPVWIIRPGCLITLKFLTM